MKRKQDVETYKKQIQESVEKLAKQRKENENLKNQLENSKVTLNINKDVIFTYASGKVNNDKILFNELKEENSRISERVNNLFDEKRSLEKQIYNVQEAMEGRIQSENDNMKKAHSELQLITNKIAEKDNTIENLKKEINKIITHKDIEFTKDVYVINPTKVYVELNTEMLYSKELTEKLSRLYQQEKEKTEVLKSEVQQLTLKLEDVRKHSNVDSSLSNKKNPSEVEFSKNREEDIDVDVDSFSDNSEEHEEVLSLENNEINKEPLNELESPHINFPDKVHMKKYHSHYESDINLPPKLDFNLLRGKYQPMSNMKFPPQAKNNPIAGPSLVPVNKQFQTNTISHFKMAGDKNVANVKKKVSKDKEIEEKLENAKNELKQSEAKIYEIQAKLDKYKKVNRDLKMKMMKLKENLKLSNNKIEVLKQQIKNLQDEVEFDESDSNFSNSADHTGSEFSDF